eukprot:g20505.t1
MLATRYPSRLRSGHSWMTPSRRRKSDPVARGAQLRELWSRDRFLRGSANRKFDLRGCGPPPQASPRRGSRRAAYGYAGSYGYVPLHQRRADEAGYQVRRQMRERFSPYVAEREGPDPHLGARGRDGGRLRAAAAALVAFQDGAGGRPVDGRKEPPSFQMGIPVLGPIIQFLKDPMELMRLGYKKMGGIFKVNFLAMDMVYLDFLDEFHMAHVLNKGQHNKKMVKLKSKAFIKLETQTFSYLKMKRNLLNEFRLDGCYMMSYLPTSMELKMKKISKVIFAKKMIYPFAKSCSMSIADKTSYMMNLRSTRKRLFTVLKKPYTENDTIGMRLEDLANLEHCKEQVLARPDSWIYNRHELLCELISKEFDMSFKKSDVRVRKRFKVASTKTPDMLLKESGMSLTFLEVAVSESSASSRFTEKVRAYSKMVSQLEKKGYEVHMGILALNLVNSKVVMDEKTEKMLMEKNMMPKLAKFMNTLNAIEEPIKKSGVKLTELGDTLNPMDKYLDQANMYKFTVPIFGPKVLYDVDYSTRTCQLRFIRERLTDSYIRSYTSTLEEEVVQFFDESRNCTDCPAQKDRGEELLTRTSIRCLMGHELRIAMTSKKPEDRSIVEMLHILEKGMLPMSVFWPNAPIQRHRERDQARREIHEMIKPILDQRRKKADKTEKDFMQSVLLLGSSMIWLCPAPLLIDQEIVGFLIAAFFGGMHNSAITTSWSTLELFSRPELVQELLEEQRAALGSDDAPFTFDAYEKMKKLRAAVSEVLRMHAPLFLLMRTVEQDVEFKGYTIRHGSVVACSPNVSQMMDDVYPKAETFDPKRFIDGIKETPLMSARMGARSVARYNREVSRLERGTTGPGRVFLHLLRRRATGMQRPGVRVPAGAMCHLAHAAALRHRRWEKRSRNAFFPRSSEPVERCGGA